MKKLFPAIAAGAVAVAVAFSPAIAATAAPAHHAAKQYTLSVDGNGKHASVVWITLSSKKQTDPYGKPIPAKPVVHSVPKAHEPWTKHVAPGAALYEIAAVQTTGSKLTCTIKDTHGAVVAQSMSRGKNTIVSCVVTTSALLATGGTGSGSGSGTGTSGSSYSGLDASARLLLPIR